VDSASTPIHSQPLEKEMKFVDTLPATHTKTAAATANRRKLEQCQANPDKWTIIQSYEVGEKSDGAPYVYANQINRGAIKSLAGLRASVRRDGNKFHVWATFPSTGSK